MEQYYLHLIIFIGSVFLLFVIAVSLMKVRRSLLLQKISRMPFPESYTQTLRQIPHYKKLTKEDQEKIERSILYFIHTKTFVGHALEVSDEMKTVIAFYACLLLLHIETTNCYDNLKTIIIYPFAMVTKEVRASGGIYTKEKFILEGQSANDTVVISWHDAKKEAYHMRHNNVIIHEFTHELDFMTGEVDGVPPLELSKYHEWTQVMTKEFNKLSTVALDNRDWGKYKILGAYASTNEAEFFAVIAERFFESPKSMRYHFPDLYTELRSFYNIDPVSFIS